MRPLTQALKRAAHHPRRLVFVMFLALAILLLAHPGALASDVFGNVGPAPQLPPGGWVGRYPVERYSLDQDFAAISVGLTSGVDASGVVPMIAFFGAQMIWLVTCFVANGVILLFTLAFNLNLLTGNGSPGSGALTPVSQAIHSMYTSTFGTPWLVAMVTLVGCWAMWKALVQRRYAETTGALAVSLLFFLVAIGIVTQPERTIGPVSKLSNQLSTALLSLANEGGIGNETQAKTAASDQLFELLVLNPWTVLEFGGIEHCAKVSHGKADSVAVRPLSRNPTRDTQLAGELEDASEVPAEGKLCINDRNKYATHFLAYRFGSKDRGYEHEALENGDDEDLPASDPAKTSGTYPLGPADEPAAEAVNKGGQYQRLLLAIVILPCELGAYLLLGGLALGVILAQILLLTLLAFSPVALLVGIFPGRGHDFFRNWLAKLAGYLARKVIYSLILAVVLAVCKALEDATSNLGWLLAFSLQAAFLWTIFLQRNKLTQDLLAASAGSRAVRQDEGRLANLYFASRLVRMIPGLPSIPHLPRLHWSKSDGDSGTPRAPGDGAPPSPVVGPPSPAGGPGGGSEAFLLPDPLNPHQTPTHGPGSPTPSSREDDPGGREPPVASPADGEGETRADGGSSASRALAHASIPSPGHPGSSPAQDELPAAENEPGQARSIIRERSSRESDQPAPEQHPPSKLTSTAGEASSTIVPGALALSAWPLTAAPVQPVAAPPPAPSTRATPVPAPGASRTLARDDTLGEEPDASQPIPSAPAAKPQANRASATPPAVQAANPIAEPVARLLAARQNNTPTDPAAPEDELA